MRIIPIILFLAVAVLYCNAHGHGGGGGKHKFGGYRHRHQATADQSAKHEKFRARQANRKFRNHRFEKEVYLRKYMEANDYDDDKAQKQLDDSIAFRDQYKIDDGESDNFDDVKNDIGSHYHLESVSKDGHPILFAPAGKMDFNKMVSDAKRRERLMKWSYCGWDSASNKAIDKSDNTTDNINTYIYILDMHGFSKEKSLSAECLVYYVEISKNLDSKWPNMLEQLIFVNVEDNAMVAINACKPMWSQQTQNNTVILGTDPEDNKAYLLEIMNEDQIPKEMYFAPAA